MLIFRKTKGFIGNKSICLFYLNFLCFQVILIILILLHLPFDLGPNNTFSDIHLRYLGFQVYYLSFYVADFIITLLLKNNLFIFFAYQLELIVDFLKLFTYILIVLIFLVKLLDQSITCLLRIFDHAHFVLVFQVQLRFSFGDFLQLFCWFFDKSVEHHRGTTSCEVLHSFEMFDNLSLPIIKVFQLTLHFLCLNRYAERSIDSRTLISPLLGRYLRNQNIFCLFDNIISLLLI